MAEQDIADIIATADDDVTWGDDMRGMATTIQLMRKHSSDHHSGLWPVAKYGPALSQVNNAGLGGAEDLTSLFTYGSFYPFYFPFDVSFDGYAMDCYTAVGGATRKVGIFNADHATHANYPGTAIANSDVTLSMAATGWITGATGATITLTGGTIYWVAQAASANGTACRAATGVGLSKPRFVSKFETVTDHLNWSNTALRKTGAFAATFPGSMASLDFTTGTTEDQSGCATLFLKRA